MEYFHGGDILGASKRFGLQKSTIIDFSSNINAVGFPDGVRELIINSIDNISVYPDNQCIDLRESISRYLNVTPNCVFPGNGAMEIIRAVLELPLIKRVVIPSPTFIEYEKIAGMVGKECHFTRLNEVDSFDFHYEDHINNLSFGDAIIICNPNNPTSNLYQRDNLVTFVEKCLRKNVNVIIDETFIELTFGGNYNSLVPYVNKFSNLIIIRAFTKYFAMPGIRLGYAICGSTISEYLWKSKMMWSVNVFASLMGKILEKQEEFRQESMNWMQTEIPYLKNRLDEIQQFRVFNPNSIFILIQILDERINSDILYQLLGEEGILVRNAKNFRFLNEKFLRVAVKDRNSNDILIEKIKKVLRF